MCWHPGVPQLAPKAGQRPQAGPKRGHSAPHRCVLRSAGTGRLTLHVLTASSMVLCQVWWSVQDSRRGAHTPALAATDPARVGAPRAGRQSLNIQHPQLWLPEVTPAPPG